MAPWDDLKYLVPFSAALVAAIGWLVNDWLKRREASRRQIERKLDFQRALRAEIRAFSDGRGMTADALDMAIAGVAEKFRDPSFVPFIPHRKNDVVFEAILPEIHVLPESVVYPVVIYYAQIRLIESVTQDMRSAEYAALPPERRCELLVDYLELLKYWLVLVLARKALFSLEDGIKSLDRSQ